MGIWTKVLAKMYRGNTTINTIIRLMCLIKKYKASNDVTKRGPPALRHDIPIVAGFEQQIIDQLKTDVVNQYNARNPQYASRPLKNKIPTHCHADENDETYTGYDYADLPKFTLLFGNKEIELLLNLTTATGITTIYTGNRIVKLFDCDCGFQMGQNYRTFKIWNYSLYSEELCAVLEYLSICDHYIHLSNDAVCVHNYMNVINGHINLACRQSNSNPPHIPRIICGHNLQHGIFKCTCNNKL